MAENRIAIRITADGSMASAAIRDVNGRLNELNRTSGLAAASLSAFRGTMAALGSVGVTVGLGALATSFVTAAENAEKLDRAMTIVTGSSESASKEMAYVADVANRFGMEANSVAEAYLAVSAAARGTALEGEKARAAFEAISLTMSKLGKSSADIQGALLGLEQTLGQSTANLEDLRQITDRIPGGMKLAADGMNMTVGTMKEMISKGEILVEDIIPALTGRMQELYDDGKEVTGLTAEWNRFTNAMADVAVGIDRASGATDILAKAMQGATWIANGLAQAMAAVASEVSVAEQAAQKLQTLREKQAKLQQEFAFQAGNLNTGKTGLWTGWLEAQLRDTATQLGAVTAEIAGMEKATNDAAAAQRKLANEQAAAVGNDAVQLWEAHKAKIEANNEAINKVVTSYDKGADKVAKMAKFEATLNEAVTLGNKTKEEAASLLEAYGKSLDGSEKKTTRATKSTGGLSKAKKEAATAAKQLAKDQRAENQAMEEAVRTVEGLIRQYLPARAAAEEYAAAMAALDQASQAVGLSQEELGTIAAGMARDQAQAAEDARRAADDFYRAWSDAVDSLDDTFQGLWRGLLSGQDDVLSNLTDTVMEWIADLSYQLLLSPLVVPIQGALLGMAGGGMGLPGGAGGMVGGVANAASGIGGMSNMFSGLSSGFNVISNLFSGATFAGITQGFSAATGVISSSGYFGGFGANMAMASGAASSGSAGFAIGAALPYAIPAAIAVAGIGAIVSKYKKDQEPRYGSLVGMTGGSVGGLEDWENGPANYSRGAFGLTFGISDKGSKNMKASELKKTYDALAEVTDVLAQFFGDDLTAFITEELKTLSTFGDGLLHLTENEGDLGAAMAMLVENIATAAGRSSEDIGIAFGAMVGDLKGSAEEVGEQIQGAMQAAIMAMQLSENHAERIGQMLGLTGAIETDADRLRGLIDTFGTASETSAETLTRLVTQLGILDQAATNTATNLAGLSTTAMIQLSDSLVDAFGGLDAAAQATAFYYQEFTTATEKLVDVVEAAGRKVTTGMADLVTDLATSLSEADMAVLSAQLNSPLLDTRAGFEELIGSLDLTTEAGQKLYAGLLKLAPAFDLLYDGVEAFEDWLLGTDAVERATRDLEKVFSDWGMSLPTTREALQALYESGMLSTEQLAILAAHLEQLGLVFGNLGTEVDTIKAKIVDYTNLEIRLAEARGDDALALQLRRQQELDAAADEHSRSLLLQIYAYEDAAAAAARAREEHRRQWEAAEVARRAAYDAEVEAIRTYNAAAQAAADEANRAARESLQALQQAAEKASQTLSAMATAWIEAISALGLVVEATALQRRLQSAALDSSLRDVYSQVWAIQDRAALAGGQANLVIQALRLMARETDAVAAERAIVLAGTDPALRGLQEWVFSLEDAQRAAEEAAAGIEEMIGSLEQVSAAIGGALERVDALLVAPMAMQVMRRAEARAQLADLLSAARAGTMPTAASLERPLATLSEDPIAQYGDQVAYLRDLGRTRGQLAELKSLVDAQIPIEQQNLEALKNLPVALYPNFEQIVSAIGTSSDDTAALLIQANAAIDAAIVAMAARDAAMEQAVKDIVPEIREIPPYVEEVYHELDLVGADIVNGNNAIIDALDQNRDGIISEMERQYPTLSALANDIALKMATTQLQVAGQVSYAEFQAMFAGLASDSEMKAWFDRLDIDQDGILSKHEIQIAKLTTGNTNETQMLSYLLNVIGKLETENVNSAMQITKLNDTIAKLQAQVTELTTIKTNTTTLTNNDVTKLTHQAKLPSIYDRLFTMMTKQDSQIAYESELPPIYDRLYTILTKNDNQLTKLGIIEGYSLGSKSNTSDTAKNTASLLQSSAINYPTYYWPSYATGGISAGPTSGYPVTLHGREAVIPLGDGNSVNAILQDPAPPPPPNYLMHEAADTQELRRALEELHQELAALRRDTQTIGAATAGELKEHNRRERRRDVNGTLVEVMA